MPKIKTISIDGFDYMKDQWNIGLSEAVVALIGPNGSGKTTFLDGIRSSIGLSQFGDRNLSKYIRQEGVIAIKYDNSPDFNGARPFREIVNTDEDTITVVQKFKRGSKHPERVFYIIPGDFDPKNVDLPPFKEALGVEAFMGKMQKVGFSDAYLRILNQAQGQIWSLLTLKPYELFTSLLDVTGDQVVMKKLNDAMEKVTRAKADHQQIAYEVSESRNRHMNLEKEKQTLDSYKDWVDKKALYQVMAKLATLNGYIRTRTSCISSINKYTENIEAYENELKKLQLSKAETLNKKTVLEGQKINAIEQRNEALMQRNEINEQVNSLKIEIGLLEAQLVEVEGLPQGTLDELERAVREIQGRLFKANTDLVNKQKQLSELNAELQSLNNNQTRYFEQIRNARRELEQHNIAFRQISDVIEIIDPEWAPAIEAHLGGNRFAFIIDALNRDELLKAKHILRSIKYPYWCAKPKPATIAVDKDSVLAKMSIPQDILGYFINLNRIMRVNTEDEAERYADEYSMESLAVDGYHTSSDSRSRVLDISKPLVCGQKIREQRKKEVESTIIELKLKLSNLTEETQKLNASLPNYLRAIHLSSVKENNPPKIKLLTEKLVIEVEKCTRAQNEFDEADSNYQIIHKQQLDIQAEESQCTAAILQNENDVKLQRELKARTEATKKKNDQDIGQIQREIEPKHLELQTTVEFEAAVYEKWVKEYDRLISDFRTEEPTAKLLEKMETIERLVENSAKRLTASEQNLVERKMQIEKAERIYQTCLEDYRQHIRHIFSLLDQKFQQKTSEYGIKTSLRPKLKEDGEVIKDEVDLKVAFDDKALAPYTSGDLSGGQKTVVSILLIMAAVQASAEINGQKSGNIDFLIFDEPAASLDSHWLEEVGRFLQQSGTQIILTLPEDEKLRNCWWADQGIFTALKKTGERYAPPLDIVKFIPDGVDCTEEESC